jgi:hypothetical protein
MFLLLLEQHYFQFGYSPCVYSPNLNLSSLVWTVKESLAPARFEPHTFQAVASRHTDYVILVACINIYLFKYSVILRLILECQSDEC